MKHYYTELEKAYIRSFAVDGVITFSDYTLAMLDVLNADIGGYLGRENVFINWVTEQVKKNSIVEHSQEIVTLVI